MPVFGQAEDDSCVLERFRPAQVVGYRKDAISEWINT